VTSGKATLTPVIGLSGEPIPFTGLVDVRPDPPGTGEVSFSLRPSPWLDGLTTRGLPAPTVILADVTAGRAALSDRPGYERVVTETLRLDLLDAPAAELHATAGTSALFGRRAVSVGTITGGPASAAAGHLTGRLVLLDSRRDDTRVSAPERVTPGATPPVRDLLADAAVVTGRSPDLVRLRLPAHGDIGNSYGYMHGGAIAVLSDIALDWLRRQPGTRLHGCHVQSVSIEYLAPVRLTGTVTVTARLAVPGPRRALVLAETAGADGLARAVASYTVRLARIQGA
jgi:acyl-coenzyme A thioesterase PaaI-like protein